MKITGIDTFVVDAFAYRLLCVFSPEGVKQLWALPERDASKGVADFLLLRHKVPEELFAGRRTRRKFPTRGIVENSPRIATLGVRMAFR